MSTADEIAGDMNAILLRRAIEIGETLIGIADAVGQSVAGNYFSIGLELLRDAANGSDDLLEVIPLQSPAR